MGSQSFNLTDYLSTGVSSLIRDAVRTSWQNPRELAFLARFAWVQCRAARLRADSEQKGRHIPPFLIASIASQCNLFCRGCYARANQSCGREPAETGLPVERWREIFAEAKELGVAFILLAGGEPLLCRPILDQAAGIPGILFPVFTNGTLIDAEYARFFSRHRNLLPVISLEGPEEATDFRRGAGAYRTVLAAIDRLRQKNVLLGTSITVTTENLPAVLNENFARTLFQQGCRILFFIEYVPVTPETRDLAPGDRERQEMEQRLNMLRRSFPEMILISFPGDEKQTGGCLAAGRGFFHINAAGGAEPCPFSPFSDLSLRDHSLLEALDSPLFRRLDQEGLLLGEHTGGCQLFEQEAEVRRLLEP